ncbi:uncharacterized protein KY384_007065 [Bacidia gigantensis]|uniref:uncharacterized protein n=1 Tax=Bacidia gigantensis TaxID=2732470 RepID=UPI001D04C8CF|nr:uncharacterized protein KY384_007065 [Bacidia gigantensis]KAG8528149.1 hypothetical protein KY384_007065 [Bacidia gigantensis]
MQPDISKLDIPHVKPLDENCLAWAARGELALAAGDQVILLIPGNRARPWSEVKVQVNKFTTTEWPQLSAEGAFTIHQRQEALLPGHDKDDRQLTPYDIMEHNPKQGSGSLNFVAATRDGQLEAFGLETTSPEAPSNLSIPTRKSQGQPFSACQQLSNARKIYATARKIDPKLVDTWVHGTASYRGIFVVCISFQYRWEVMYKTTQEQKATLLFGYIDLDSQVFHFPWQDEIQADVSEALGRVFQKLKMSVEEHLSETDITLRFYYNAVIVALTGFHDSSDHRLLVAQAILDHLINAFNGVDNFSKEAQFLKLIRANESQSRLEMLAAIPEFLRLRLPELLKHERLKVLVDQCPVCEQPLTFGPSNSAECLNKHPLGARCDLLTSSSPLKAMAMPIPDRQKGLSKTLKTRPISFGGIFSKSPIIVAGSGNPRRSMSTRMSTASDEDNTDQQDSIASVSPQPNQKAILGSKFGSEDHSSSSAVALPLEPNLVNLAKENVDNRFSKFSFVPSYATSSVGGSQSVLEGLDEHQSGHKDDQTASRFGSVSTSSEYPPGTSQKVKSPPPGNRAPKNSLAHPSDAESLSHVMEQSFNLESSSFSFLDHGSAGSSEDGIMIVGESERGSEASVPLAMPVLRNDILVNNTNLVKSPLRLEKDRDDDKIERPDIVIQSPNTPTFAHVKEEPKSPRASRALHVPFLQRFKPGGKKAKNRDSSGTVETVKNVPHGQQHLDSFFDAASSEGDEDRAHDADDEEDADDGQKPFFWATPHKPLFASQPSSSTAADL